MLLTQRQSADVDDASAECRRRGRALMLTTQRQSVDAVAVLSTQCRRSTASVSTATSRYAAPSSTCCSPQHNAFPPLIIIFLSKENILEREREREREVVGAEAER